MSRVLHEIEKKIIAASKIESKLTPEKLEKLTKLSPDQVRRGVEWLKLKELAIVHETKKVNFSLGKNGLESLQKGLPERRLLDLIKKSPMNISDLQKKTWNYFWSRHGFS